MFKNTKDKQTEKAELVTIKEQESLFTKLLNKIKSLLVPKIKENRLKKFANIFKIVYNLYDGALF